VGWWQMALAWKQKQQQQEAGYILSPIKAAKA